MEVTVHLDGNPTVREEGFFASKVVELENQVKALGFDNAELVKANDELRERVNKLASRQPSWPKGYRPQNRRR
jgi:cell division protein FtsB